MAIVNIRFSRSILSINTFVDTDHHHVSVGMSASELSQILLALPSKSSVIGMKEENKGLYQETVIQVYNDMFIDGGEIAVKYRREVYVDKQTNEIKQFNHFQGLDLTHALRKDNNV